MDKPDAPEIKVAEAVVVFQNIADLLRVGMFQGEHGAMVNDAIVFLEKIVETEKAKAARDAEALRDPPDRLFLGLESGPEVAKDA